MDDKLNILLIDDDDVDRMSVRRFFKSAGVQAQFTEAGDGRNGLELLQKNSYDCAFLDYFLPDSDGLAVLKQARDAGIETPIIMLTGHGDERLAVELIRAGASDYLPKGQVSADALSHALHNAMRMHQLEQERSRAEAELNTSNKRIIDILESISDAFFALDDNWRFTYLNQQAERLLHANRNVLLNQDLNSRLPNLATWFKDAMHRSMTQKVAVTCEGRYELLGKWLEAQIYPGHEGISVYFRDITERKQAEERLSYLANFDALTDLPNRTLLLDRINQAMTRAPWHQRSIAVLFCDLDRFKIVNDSLGHNVGDELLKAVAQRIRTCLRDGDTVARLGGDEFVILLTDLAKADDVGKIAQKIITRISEPLRLEGHEVYVTASIGISVFPEDGIDASILLKNADIAMYRAKKQGKNNFQIYSQALDTRSSHRLTLESALHRGIEQGELRAHFQPQINLSSGCIIGAEALVRWQHPEMGMVSPADFLPIAEETGLIATIDKWVLHNACAQNKRWREMGLPAMRVAVNMSNQLFNQPGLAQLVADILTETGLPADALELEITEAVAMHDAKQALATLNELCELGVHLAIDDFGTGYSSLSYLKRYPIHTLKIDRSFIRDIATDPDDAAIIEAIIAMSHKLNLSIVAEGVETTEQQAFLIQQRCDMMQGFLFSRPLPADEFTALAQKHTGTAF